MKPEQWGVWKITWWMHAGPGRFTLVMMLPPHEDAAPVGQVVRHDGQPVPPGLIFFYFILPDFLFWAGMVDDGGMKRVKMKVVKDGKNFPHLLHFPARTEMLLGTACCSSGSGHCDRCSRLWHSLLWSPPKGELLSLRWQCEPSPVFWSPRHILNLPGVCV